MSAEPRLPILMAQVLLVLLAAPNTVFADAKLPPGGQSSGPGSLLSKGEAIWKTSCASCHGAKGEGVEGVYDDPLIGDEPVNRLADLIGKTMPEGEPEKCQGDDAAAVAAWAHHEFYSEAARVRNRSARIMLTHLTGSQLRQSLADLYGRYRGSMWRESKRGVNATYFDGARWKKENLKIERVDPVINFDWGKESPGEEIKAEAFYVHWRTGLKVDETGRYEIVVRSSAAFKMEFGRFGRMFLDNHVQSGDKTEFRKSVTLLAGRVYPLQIEMYQRERKTEQPPVKVSLSWVRPHGVEEIIPSRNLIAASPPSTFALQTRLPPDDRSYGFERGLAVDSSWDESTTLAAAEFSSIAVSELWPDYLKSHKKDEDENRAKLRGFLADTAEVAFRGPLHENERTFYVDDQVDATEDDALAIKRCLLTILKSPRFLYPELDRDRSGSQRAANRLALTLFDSLATDKSLLEAVGKNELETEDQIRRMAQRMVSDYRCEGKAREMLFEWLNLSHIGDITKNSEQYPQFDPALAADLRASLNAMLDDAIIDSDGDFRQLFQADWVYTNARLADFYGGAWAVPDINAAKPAEQDVLSENQDKADGETRAEIADSSDKTEPLQNYVGLRPVSELVKTRTEAPYNRGILSHPYLMSGLAYSNTTSPIHRGVFLIRYMLGRTLRPPNEAFTPLSPEQHKDLTTRQRVELQTGDVACQVCHSKINPLGFTLENFDAVGRFRDMEGQKSIDVSGSYIDRKGETKTFGGADELAEYLASSDEAHRAFVNRTFQHFVKQPIAAYGPEKLDKLTEKFRAGNYNLRNLLVEIAVVAATPPPSSTPPPST